MEVPLTEKGENQENKGGKKVPETQCFTEDTPTNMPNVAENQVEN